MGVNLLRRTVGHSHKFNLKKVYFAVLMLGFYNNVDYFYFYTCKNLNKQRDIFLKTLRLSILCLNIRQNKVFKKENEKE